MKKLKDFEKEINKCSKCGLCQAVCPIFQLTGNECAVSKGKFVMLSGVLKKDLKLNENINSYLDLCTKCGKCTEFCPAGINVCEIFQTAKYEYLSTKPFFTITKLFQSKIFFNTIIKIGHTLSKPFRAKNICSQHEILYFKGCVNEIFPNRENALKKILGKTKINLLGADFDCCGLPFFSSGNLERFEYAKNLNTELINTSTAEFILTDCASCEHTLKNYNNINKKIISTEEFLDTLNLEFTFKKHQKIAFHKPCHAGNDMAIKILHQCQNIELVEIPDTCCGLAGDFFLKKPEIANALAKKRAEEIINSGATIVITTCPACEIGLKKALWPNKIKVFNLIDFLATADIV